MKYSDEQRIQKIYEYASKLISYLETNNITKEALLEETALQWLVTTPLYLLYEIL